MPAATAPAPAVLPDLSHVPYARGYVEHLTPLEWQFKVGGWTIDVPNNRVLRPKGIYVSGWMFLADGPFDRIHAYVNGREYFTCEPFERVDIAAAFPHVRDAGRCGFTFNIPPKVARRGHLAIVGHRKKRPAGKVVLRFRDDLPSIVPVPPPELTDRVVSTRKKNFFLAQGYKSYSEIKAAVAQHRPVKTIGRLLDWGCGCGRLTAHWLRRKEKIEVHGCDIDPEAIGWCRDNLPKGKFECVNFDPPTPYPDGHFDAIFGYSVFTHLTEKAQHAWLAEMRRILAPGGTFVATLQGPSAAWFVFGDPAHEMLKSGIHDETHDPGMEHVLADGEYRSTYQTPEWTRANFGRYFEVVEYVERAIGNNQDLCVLRKPA